MFTVTALRCETRISQGTAIAEPEIAWSADCVRRFGGTCTTLAEHPHALPARASQILEELHGPHHPLRSKLREIQQIEVNWTVNFTRTTAGTLVASDADLAFCRLEAQLVAYGRKHPTEQFSFERHVASQCPNDFGNYVCVGGGKWQLCDRKRQTVTDKHVCELLNEARRQCAADLCASLTCFSDRWDASRNVRHVTEGVHRDVGGCVAYFTVDLGDNMSPYRVYVAPDVDGVVVHGVAYCIVAITGRRALGLYAAVIARHVSQEFVEGRPEFADEALREIRRMQHDLRDCQREMIAAEAMLGATSPVELRRLESERIDTLPDEFRHDGQFATPHMLSAYAALASATALIADFARQPPTVQEESMRSVMLHVKVARIASERAYGALPTFSTTPNDGMGNTLPVATWTPSEPFTVVVKGVPHLTSRFVGNVGKAFLKRHGWALVCDMEKSEPHHAATCCFLHLVKHSAPGRPPGALMVDDMWIPEALVTVNPGARAARIHGAALCVAEGAHDARACERVHLRNPSAYIVVAGSGFIETERFTDNHGRRLAMCQQPHRGRICTSHPAAMSVADCPFLHISDRVVPRQTFEQATQVVGGWHTTATSPARRASVVSLRSPYASVAERKSTLQSSPVSADGPPVIDAAFNGHPVQVRLSECANPRVASSCRIDVCTGHAPWISVDQCTQLHIKPEHFIAVRSRSLVSQSSESVPDHGAEESSCAYRHTDQSLSEARFRVYNAEATEASVREEQRQPREQQRRAELAAAAGGRRAPDVWLQDKKQYMPANRFVDDAGLAAALRCKPYPQGSVCVSCGVTQPMQEHCVLLHLRTGVKN